MKHRKSRYSKQREEKLESRKQTFFYSSSIHSNHSFTIQFASVLASVANQSYMHKSYFIITQHTVADRTGGVVAEFRTENEHPGDSQHLDIFFHSSVFH